MKFFETISSAINSITGNKMRAMFTMFGIIVGIASVMLITSVGDGFRNTMHGFFEDLGLDEIQIFHTNAVRQIEWHERMTLDDAEFFLSHPAVHSVTTVANMNAANAVQILGTTDTRAVSFQGRDHHAINFGTPARGGDLIAGRYISEQDVLTAANVIIIDETMAYAVFGTTQNILGRDLEIRTGQGMQRFSVIGMFEADDAMMLGDLFEMPFEVVVPVSFVQRHQNMGNVVGQLRVRVYDTDIIHQTGDNLIHLLEIRRGAQDIFNSFSMASALEETDAVIGVFTVFLTMVASISLLVGGIGVMNIMLVSVTERTREIGIRKSLGATSGNIVFQFLIEAAVLTLVGGAIGVLLGYVGGIGVGRLASALFNMELVPTINIGTIVTIVLISGFIGLLFGVYPARKASKLDPVESLRFE